MAMNIISLGAGVQSTAMALMAAIGAITPMPDAAIFADTGDEPGSVYQHLAWLMSGVLPFPVHVTQDRGKMSDAVLSGNKEARPPLFIRTKKGRGMLGRQCTRNFKLHPIRRKTREILGVGIRAYIPPGAVVSWVGISADEVIRAKPSGLRYITNRHPLLELKMSRSDCLAWLASWGYPEPPKSSCGYCPYKSDAQWLFMKENEPADWEKAVEFDREVRRESLVKLYGAEGFVHSSLVPLGEAQLKPKDDKPNLFINDCEGLCGA